MAKSCQADFATFHQAAHEAELSGRAASQRAICLAWVNSHPGQTAAEIARAVGLERHAPSRRLPELRDRRVVINGDVRTCTITGRQSMTWLAVTEAAS